MYPTLDTSFPSTIHPRPIFNSTSFSVHSFPATSHVHRKTIAATRVGHASFGETECGIIIRGLVLFKPPHIISMLISVRTALGSTANSPLFFQQGMVRPRVISLRRILITVRLHLIVNAPPCES